MQKFKIPKRKMAVNLYGGGRFSFDMSKLVAVGKHEGITAITLINEKDPIQILGSAGEFWYDFNARRKI